MDPLEWPYRLRTARQKKRLVRKDLDKQLIELSRKQGELSKQRYLNVRYVYAEPWHFVLKVLPHIIYEVQLCDQVLEQEIAALDNYIARNNLWYRINRLTNGKSCKGWVYIEKPKYFNELKNMPRYANKEAYLD